MATAATTIREIQPVVAVTPPADPPRDQLRPDGLAEVKRSGRLDDLRTWHVAPYVSDDILGLPVKLDVSRREGPRSSGVAPTT